MSISPLRVDTVGDRKIERYSLPICAGGNILSLEKETDSYSAVWEVSYNAHEFVRRLSSLPELYSVEQEAATVTIEQSPGNEVEEETRVSVLRSTGVPENTTCLRIQTDRCNIAWEDWNEPNKVVFRANSHNLTIFKEFYYELVEEHNELLVNQVEQILSQEPCPP